MTVLSTFAPSTMASRGLTAIRTMQNQLLLRWQRAKARRAEAFRLTEELAGCTDRQLADLGLYRSDIPAVVQGTYRRT